MKQRGRAGIDWSQMRITRGALVIVGLEIGVSLVYMMLDPGTRARFLEYVAASPSQVFEHYRVWTLVTSPLLEANFLSLLLSVFVLWMFVPTLERFWGTARFYRFLVITSVAGTLAGSAVGLATGRDFPILGLSPFVYASMVAFGMVYARQPVQVFGVLPLTGRQMMYGFIGFLVLYVGLQQLWEMGAAFAAAMIVAAVLTSKRWSPGLAWRKWRIARARRRLSVIEGGVKPPPRTPTKPRDEQRWLN